MNTDPRRIGKLVVITVPLPSDYRTGSCWNRLSELSVSTACTLILKYPLPNGLADPSVFS
ncbi:MAG: hypothetical protein ACLSUW_00180 [Akkermansia sp.]